VQRNKYHITQYCTHISKLYTTRNRCVLHDRHVVSAASCAAASLHSVSFIGLTLGYKQQHTDFLNGLYYKIYFTQWKKYMSCKPRGRKAWSSILYPMLL